MLLTDFVLPGIHGAEVARKSKARWPQIGIILMSGYAKEGVIREQFNGDAVRFLQKPFDMSVLERELETVLNLAREIPPPH